MSAAKKGMKKSTYLIIWTLVIALLGSAIGVVNYEALYWDSALTLYFGEVGVKNVSTVTFDTDDHAQVANLIVAEGAVLLKNEKNAAHEGRQNQPLRHRQQERRFAEGAGG